MLVFDIPGEPCAQGRPRFTTISGHPHAYDPEKSKNYKAFVKVLAKEALDKCGWRYTELPLKMTISCYLELPKSKSKKYKTAALEGKAFPTKKPDVDNLFKTITDALSGVAYKDDKQIIIAVVSKFYAEKPSVTVKVELLGGIP